MRDQLALPQNRLPLRSIAGEPVELGLGYLALRSIDLLRMHYGVERDQGHAHVGGMCGDAAVAAAEHRMHAVEACQGIASRAGFPLIALRIHVAEVSTARPLHQVAAGTCHIAQLRGSSGQQGFREDRETLADGWMVR